MTERLQPVARVAAAAVLLAGIVAAGASSGGGDDDRAGVAASIDGAVVAPPGSGAELSDGDATEAAAASAAAAAGSAAAPLAATRGGAADEPSAAGAATPAASAPLGTKVPAGDGVRGVTDEIVQIGLVTADPGAVSAGAAAVGGGDPRGENASVDDVERAYRAILKHVNDNGGVAGRRLEPVFAFVDVTGYVTASGRQREQQKACAIWTEDNPVFAISGDGMNEDVMIECARNARTPFVAAGFQAYLTRRMFEEMSPYWYAPHGMLAERREATVGQGLIDNGFFDDGARVAVLVEDKPAIRAGVEGGLRPVLARAGIEPVLEIAYPDIIESPWANYVLQLQSAGVTHVVFSADTGAQWPAVFMTRAAESQQYRPRWGLGSDNGPAALTAYETAQAQLENVAGVGWLPMADTGDLSVRSEPDALCRKLMEELGWAEPWGASDACEVIFFLKAALDNADEVSPAGMARGTAALGESHQSVATMGGATHFGPGWHDGPVVMRPIGYDAETCGQEGSSCLRYTGEPYRVNR